MRKKRSTLSKSARRAAPSKSPRRIAVLSLRVSRKVVETNVAMLVAVMDATEKEDRQIPSDKALNRLSRNSEMVILDLVSFLRNEWSPATTVRPPSTLARGSKS